MFVVSVNYGACNVVNSFGVTCNVSVTVCIPYLSTPVFRCYKDFIFVGMTESEFSRFEFYCPKCFLLRGVTSPTYSPRRSALLRYLSDNVSMVVPPAMYCESAIGAE